MQFEFSDTIAGYVIRYENERESFLMRTSDGRECAVKLTTNTFARRLRNLDEPYYDCTSQLSDLLLPDQYLFVYGIYYPEKGGHTFEAKVIDFPDNKIDRYRFEEPDWWIKQASSIADFFIKAHLGYPS